MADEDARVSHLAAAYAQGKPGIERRQLAAAVQGATALADLPTRWRVALTTYARNHPDDPRWSGITY